MLQAFLSSPGKVWAIWATDLILHCTNSENETELEALGCNLSCTREAVITVLSQL